ncbi:hypothetical protein [Rhodoligotrophos ferricapiens]|uniref:hypothetical protein n=1 Tax=Rhodoligotrophos ferricapiens TaxID=3069264 RepID=UPI00315CC73E
MAIGRVPLSVREPVLQSWQRSASSGITSLKSAPKLGESELVAHRQEARRLRLGARAALQKAGYLLNHTGNMLLLCSNSGVVLDVAGDEVTQARGRENHLHVGGRWSESSIGTNAIGTAIHLRRPIQVEQRRALLRGNPPLELCRHADHRSRRRQTARHCRYILAERR